MKYFFSFILIIVMSQVQAQKAYIDDLLDMYAHKSDIPYFIRRGIKLGFERYGGNLCKTSIDVNHVEPLTTESITLDTKDTAFIKYHTRNHEIYDDWVTWLQDNQYNLVQTSDDIIDLIYHQCYFYESSAYSIEIDKFEGSRGMRYNLIIKELPKKQ